MKIFVAATLLFAASAFAAEAPNVAGQWSIHINVAGNESDSQCNFVLTDDKLTGTCTSEGKSMDLTGSLDGKELAWKYESEYNGGPLTLTYKGKLDDSGKITGTVDVDPYGVTGDFTATPSKDPGK